MRALLDINVLIARLDPDHSASPTPLFSIASRAALRQPTAISTSAFSQR